MWGWSFRRCTWRRRRWAWARAPLAAAMPNCSPGRPERTIAPRRRWAEGDHANVIEGGPGPFHPRRRDGGGPAGRADRPRGDDGPVAPAPPEVGAAGIEAR